MVVATLGLIIQLTRSQGCLVRHASRACVDVDDVRSGDSFGFGVESAGALSPFHHLHAQASAATPFPRVPRDHTNEGERS